MQNLAINYQGRKTSRQSSEYRRLAILQATLRVVIRDGVRGVRHRAVAKEADVPLSATTYYFKDIHDLLTDAFTLFAKENLETLINPFWARTQEWMQAYDREQVRQDAALRLEVMDRIAGAGADYIMTRVMEHRESVIMDYAFWYAALQDERLHEMARQYSERLVANYTPMLEFLGLADIEQRAKAIFSTARRVEYEALVGVPDKEAIKQALLFQIKAVVNI